VTAGSTAAEGGAASLFLEGLWLAHFTPGTLVAMEKWTFS